MKICIICSSRKLGYDLAKSAKDHQVFLYDRKKLDVTNIKQVNNILKNIEPDVIIHAEEYSNIKKCELNQDLAYRINVTGTENIAQITKRLNSKLIFISSDYVFDGEKGSPYNEYEIPNPQNQYGKTKYAAEVFIQQYLDKYYIVRTGTIFNHMENNFINSTLNLINNNSLFKVVNDQIMSITYSVDLSRAIIELATNNYNYGIYHFINEGNCSWFELAKEIFKIKKMDVKMMPISLSEVQENVQKPKNSSLNNNSIIKLRFWKEALEEYLKKSKIE